MKIYLKQTLIRCFDYSKRIIKAILLFIVKYIVLPLVILFFLFNAVINIPHIIPNNLRARVLLKKLERIPPPEGAKRLGDYRAIGMLTRPGSNPPCDIFQGILYGIDDTGGINAHYSDNQIIGFGEPETLYVKTIILKSNNTKHENAQVPGEDSLFPERITRAMEKRCEKARSCYLVYVMDRSNLKLDARCP